MMLDLESVRLFVLTAEYGNLTRAAEAAGTVQPVVSQRIKRLEAAVGCKLLDRTPRLVRLTEAGSIFLQRARLLLDAHAAAFTLDRPDPFTIAIGISDHALGLAFSSVFRHLRAGLPAEASLSVRLGQSLEVRGLFERGEVDLAIIRRDGGGSDGEVLGEDPLEWRAPNGWQSSGGQVPVVTLPAPCGVRAVALKALDRAEMPWREAFVGGSCLAVVTAVQAGLGVAPLGRMIGSTLAGCDCVSTLPSLPTSQIVMLARSIDAHTNAAARTLAASVREILKNNR
jgi:DNA-binding transcriptional LysR family regulator